MSGLFVQLLNTGTLQGSAKNIAASQLQHLNYLSYLEANLKLHAYIIQPAAEFISSVISLYLNLHIADAINDTFFSL